MGLFDRFHKKEEYEISDSFQSEPEEVDYGFPSVENIRNLASSPIKRTDYPTIPTKRLEVPEKTSELPPFRVPSATFANRTESKLGETQADTNATLRLILSKLEAMDERIKRIEDRLYGRY